MRKIAMHKMFLVIYSVYLKASYTVKYMYVVYSTTLTCF